MPITIGSNIASLRAQRAVWATGEIQSSTLQKLASGQRINRASDDAAGLSVGMSLNNDTRVFAQAIRNVNDGISALNVAEGALQQLTTISIRQKELATQAANGTFSLAQRRALSAEANALVDEFNRIIESTKFNGIRLTDKSLSELRIQAGFGASGSIGFEIGDKLARAVGTGSFAAPSLLSAAGMSPTEIALGDLNGDSKLDIVCGGTGGAAAWLGRGDGTFLAPTGLGALGSPEAITLADVNQDSILDVLSGDMGSHNLCVSLGKGDGTFYGPRSYATGFEPSSIVAADLNRDGALDIINGDFVGQSVSIRFGNGDGTFRGRVSLSTNNDGVQNVSVGDLNGDNVLDIVAGGWDLNLYIGNGDGTFRRSSGGTAGWAATLADVNGDDILDLGTISSTHVLIHLGKGDGTFRAARSYQSGTNPASLSFRDMTGDGIADAVAPNQNSDSVSLFIGRGDGTFSPRIVSATGDDPRYLAVGDLNGDGAPDAVTANLWEDRVRVLLAKTTEVTTAPRLNLRTREGALEALNTAEAALQRISQELGAIGSTQSRFAVAVNTIAASRENFAAAAGRIMDADVAKESADMTRMRILQQAAGSVLAQANQQPALALQLLSAS